jgi:SAM-dependent methyltransferase
VQGFARSALALLWILPKQAYYEAFLHRFRRIRFRSRDNGKACEAYLSMDAAAFEGVNARQAWANWRTITRNLAGRLPGRPVQAIDLCSGTGRSTEVLAHCLASGSRILGLEINPSFVKVARSRVYSTRGGEPVEARFRAQSVLETFEDPVDGVVPDASIDLVSASGAVGCHFDAKATSVLAREIDRVLRPGGLALVDSGPAGTPERDVRSIFGALGFVALQRTRSCLFDRYRQICFRKASPHSWEGLASPTP